jgi:hypothetical protein
VSGPWAAGFDDGGVRADVNSTGAKVNFIIATFCGEVANPLFPTAFPTARYSYPAFATAEAYRPVTRYGEGCS